MVLLLVSVSDTSFTIVRFLTNLLTVRPFSAAATIPGQPALHLCYSNYPQHTSCGAVFLGLTNGLA